MSEVASVPSCSSGGSPCFRLPADTGALATCLALRTSCKVFPTFSSHSDFFMGQSTAACGLWQFLTLQRCSPLSHFCCLVCALHVFKLKLKHRRCPFGVLATDPNRSSSCGILWNSAALPCPFPLPFGRGFFGVGGFSLGGVLGVFTAPGLLGAPPDP